MTEVTIPPGIDPEIKQPTSAEIPPAVETMAVEHTPEQQRNIDLITGLQEKYPHAFTELEHPEGEPVLFFVPVAKTAAELDNDFYMQTVYLTPDGFAATNYTDVSPLDVDTNSLRGVIKDGDSFSQGKGQIAKERILKPDKVDDYHLFNFGVELVDIDDPLVLKEFSQAVKMAEREGLAAAEAQKLSQQPNHETQPQMKSVQELLSSI